MKFFKLLNLMLAAAIILLSLAACSNNAPSLDLSQNDPFGNFPETTSAEPSSADSSDDTDTESSDSETTTDSDATSADITVGETEDTYETTVDTIETTEDTSSEETTEPEETFPAEIDGLTFIYTLIPDTQSCSISTVIGAGAELEIPSTIDGYTVAALASGSLSFAKDITALTLPSTINAIGADVFSPCTSLQEVRISDMNAWLNIRFASQSSSPMYRAKQILLNGQPITEITIPEGLTAISDYALYNFRSLSDVRLPSSIEQIGINAFSNSGTRNVYIPTLADWFEIEFGNTAANPLSSARNLYVGDKKVNVVAVPDEITEIKPFAFCGFGGIHSIEIHGGVKSIGSSAFLDCPSLSLVIIRDVASWCEMSFENENANPLTVAKTLCFNDGTNTYPLTAVEVPATVTKISPYAFCGATNITAVAFATGSQLTTIGTGAFKGCTNLATIYIPETVTVIESLAFSNCPNISYFTINGINYLGSFTNPQHALISVAESNTGLTTLVIPGTTKVIYQAALSYCVTLENVVIPDSVEYIGNSAFYNCSTLKTVTLGSGITEIGSSAFSNCSSLLSLTIPEGVTTVGRSALSGCSALTSLTLPSTLTYIDQYAFRDCKKLASVTIPAAVDYIGSCAFSGCKVLESVTFENPGNWYAGDTKISSNDLGSAAVAAYYLTEDHLLKIWTKK